MKIKNENSCDDQTRMNSKLKFIFTVGQIDWLDALGDIQDEP